MMYLLGIQLQLFLTCCCDLRKFFCHLRLSSLFLICSSLFEISTRRLSKAISLIICHGSETTPACPGHIVQTQFNQTFLNPNFFLEPSSVITVSLEVLTGCHRSIERTLLKSVDFKLECVSIYDISDATVFPQDMVIEIVEI